MRVSSKPNPNPKALPTPTPTPNPHGAALSSTWLEEHVERVVLIGAPLLGAPKVIAGMLMGESRDFTHVTGLLAKLVDAVPPDTPNPKP